MGKSGHYEHRSSESGRFVTEKYADKHPSTTQREIIPNPGRGDSDKSKK